MMCHPHHSHSLSTPSTAIAGGRDESLKPEVMVEGEEFWGTAGGGAYDEDEDVDEEGGILTREEEEEEYTRKQAVLDFESVVGARVEAVGRDLWPEVLESWYVKRTADQAMLLFNRLSDGGDGSGDVVRRNVAVEWYVSYMNGEDDRDDNNDDDDEDFVDKSDEEEEGIGRATTMGGSARIDGTGGGSGSGGGEQGGSTLLARLEKGGGVGWKCGTCMVGNPPGAFVKCVLCGSLKGEESLSSMKKPAGVISSASSPSALPPSSSGPTNRMSSSLSASGSSSSNVPALSLSSTSSSTSRRLGVTMDYDTGASAVHIASSTYYLLLLLLLSYSSSYSVSLRPPQLMEAFQNLAFSSPLFVSFCSSIEQ